MNRVLIGTGKNSVGIGDVMLVVTVAQQALRHNSGVALETTPKVAEWLDDAFVHQGLFGNFGQTVEIIAKNDPFETPNAPGPGTFLERKLRHYGFAEDALPKFYFSGCEQEPNGVAVCTHCSRKWQHLRGGHNRDWSEDRRKYSNMPVVNIDSLCSIVRSPWDGSSPVFDEPVSISDVFTAMATCHTYIGVDTGWMHVAVAMGMKVICYRPDSCPDYRHEDWAYSDHVVEYRKL